MFIPLRTNRTPRRRPIVTEGLIVANMLVYLAGLAAEYGGLFDRTLLTDLGALARVDFHPWQLVTYQFLHDPWSVFHLAFNMLFLWVFGSAVEDRMSRVSYLAFYLLGGVVAGVGHMMTSAAPVIGASGSVAAITGAFLALFPRSTIRVLVFFFLIGVYDIPSLWFIGLYFLIDVLRSLADLLGGRESGVAYAAHLAGYLYGFGLAFALLALRIIPREQYDILFLFTQAKRRRRFRAASRSQAGGLWADASRSERDLARAGGAARGPLTPEEERSLASRAEIRAAYDAHDLATAAERYRTLLDQDPSQVFPETMQLDLANQLQAGGHLETAVTGYELFLGSYRAASKTPEVQLMLASLYARRLARPDRAGELLAACRGRLTDPGLIELAETLATEIAP